MDRSTAPPTPTPSMIPTALASLPNLSLAEIGRNTANAVVTTVAGPPPKESLLDQQNRLMYLALLFLFLVVVSQFFFGRG